MWYNMHNKTFIILIIKTFLYTGVELIYNVVLISLVHPSDAYIQVLFFFRFFARIECTEF